MVITVEWLQSRKREKKEGERNAQVQARIAVLQGVMREGQALQAAVPPSVHNPAVATWPSLVKAWTNKTQVLVKSYSAQAETAFTHNSLTFAASSNFGCPIECAAVGERLNNLRGIIENPEVYL